MIAYNLTRQAVVADRVAKADDAESRARGLLGRASLGAGEGLWIVNEGWHWVVPCPTIHTLFMKFAIDVVFLDAELKVVRVIDNLKPWRFSPWVWRSRSVLELPAGTLMGRIAVGDRLEMKG